MILKSLIWSNDVLSDRLAFYVFKSSFEKYLFELRVVDISENQLLLLFLFVGHLILRNSGLIKVFEFALIKGLHDLGAVIFIGDIGIRPWIIFGWFQILLIPSGPIRFQRQLNYKDIQTIILIVVFRGWYLLHIGFNDLSDTEFLLQHIFSA